jgi:hypothetical protein
MVAPIIDAAAEAHAEARRIGGSCARSVHFLRGFWPMVDRHDEHPGSATAGGHDAGANRSRLERVDCTHWLPCSSAMNLQLRLLVGAVTSLSDARFSAPTPAAAAHQRPRGRA